MSLLSAVVVLLLLSAIEFDPACLRWLCSVLVGVGEGKSNRKVILVLGICYFGGGEYSMNEREQWFKPHSVSLLAALTQIEPLTRQRRRERTVSARSNKITTHTLHTYTYPLDQLPLLSFPFFHFFLSIFTLHSNPLLSFTHTTALNHK